MPQTNWVENHMPHYPYAVWPDLAKFHHFGNYLKILGIIFKVYLVLGKVFISLWHNLYAFGQIFVAVNGQILKTQSGHLVTLSLYLPGFSSKYANGKVFVTASGQSYKASTLENYNSRVVSISNLLVIMTLQS